MKLADTVVVVTGGGNGIGRALCRRFAAEGARAVVAADIDIDAAQRVADEVDGAAMQTDVARGDDVERLVAAVAEKFGPIDLFCSNAGIIVDGDERTPDAEWARCWQVNVMGHVHAARAVLPSMLARGRGYLLQTVSAAGLLTHIESATYAVTKHASLAFAEWLSISYGDRGIKVSALCPQGVRTDMLERARLHADASARQTQMLLDGALEPDQVAEAVVKGLADECFLILPHRDVSVYFKRKAADYDRWLNGMRRLRGQP